MAVGMGIFFSFSIFFWALSPTNGAVLLSNVMILRRSVLLLPATSRFGFSFPISWTTQEAVRKSNSVLLTDAIQSTPAIVESSKSAIYAPRCRTLSIHENGNWAAPLRLLRRLPIHRLARFFPVSTPSDAAEPSPSAIGRSKSTSNTQKIFGGTISIGACQFFEIRDSRAFHRSPDILPMPSCRPLRTTASKSSG